MLRDDSEEADADASDELADVVIYCLSLSGTLELDITEALRRKLEKNRKEYPVMKIPA